MKYGTPDSKEKNVTSQILTTSTDELLYTLVDLIDRPMLSTADWNRAMRLRKIVSARMGVDVQTVDTIVADEIADGAVA